MIVECLRRVVGSLSLSTRTSFVTVAVTLSRAVTEDAYPFIASMVKCPDAATFDFRLTSTMPVAISTPAPSTGLKSYYQAKIEAAELEINQKTQNLRRLEAQRNALNARGMPPSTQESLRVLYLLE